MSSEPLISIGLSYRNAQSTLAMAIRSILAQTYRTWELLLVNDGSTDLSPEIARSFDDGRIRHLGDDSPQGLAVRLNQAIQAAHGPLFARMDADDLCFPSRLEVQARALAASPEIDLMGGRVVVFAQNGRLLGGLPFCERHEDVIRQPWNWIPLAHPTWLGRTLWFRTHTYDPTFSKAQDQEMLLRAMPASRYGCCPDLVLAYRQERLSLRRIAATRFHHARALVQHFHRSRRIVFARGAIAEIAKLGVDAVAIGTGLRYRLLRHRCLPADAVDAQAFLALWSSLQENPCAA